MESFPKKPKPTQSRKLASHERILDVAAGAVGRNGVAGVGIAEVMKLAGLTHGGFYAHFKSRQAMLTAAIEHAGKASAKTLARGIAARRALGDSPFRALVETYLSEQHLASPETSCPLAALGAEASNQSTDLCDITRKRVDALVGMVKQALPTWSEPGSEVVIASTLVGALQMARIFKTDASGKEFLSTTRKMLIQQHDVSKE